MNVRVSGQALRIDRARDGRAHERGAVLVIVALGAIALFAAAALGIDGGRLFLERRYAQAAADHAAITASWTRCTGATVNRAIQDGLAAAARNGYGNDGVTNTVSVAWTGGRQFLATVISTIPATFARVIGVATFDVRAEALSDCTGGDESGPGAVYAGGDDCIKSTNGKYQLDVSGSNQTVTGGVHANGDVNIGSDPNAWTNGIEPPDPFTFVGTMWPSLSPPDNTFEPGYPQDVGPGLPDPQWPAGWWPSDAAVKVAELEAIAAANGTFYSSKVTSLTQNGVIATSHPDGMDISSVSPGVDTVTLVARNGPIKISISNATFTAHTDGILMLATPTYGSTERCDKFSIAISGGAANWIGLIWGPTGLVEFSGSDGSSVDGSLIGWAVRLNGSNITIAYTPDPSPDEPDVQLLQ